MIDKKESKRLKKIGFQKGADSRRSKGKPFKKGHKTNVGKTRKFTDRHKENISKATNKGGYLSRGYKIIRIFKDGHSREFREHRLIVEKKIGRKLRPKEIVHHIDGDRSNNHINNLMLFKNNAQHIKFHTKIRQFGFTTPILKQIEKRWKK